MTTALTALLAFLEVLCVSVSTVAAQSSPGIHCSLQGYDGGIESFMTTTDGTYLGCSNACYQQPNCKMFGYAPPQPGSTIGDCQLYNTLTAKNWRGDNTSPYFFWDVGCEKVIPKCNYLGVDRFHGPITKTDTSDLSSDQQSLQACRARCTTNPSCKSYAWTETSCILYDVPVTGNFLYGDGNQPVSRFYDLACTLTSSSSSSARTTTATTLQTSTRVTTAITGVSGITSISSTKGIDSATGTSSGVTTTTAGPIVLTVCSG